MDPNVGPGAVDPNVGPGAGCKFGRGAGCESGAGAGCESGPGAGCETGRGMRIRASAGCESGGRMLKPVLARFESGPSRMLKPTASMGGVGDLGVKVISR